MSCHQQECCDFNIQKHISLFTTANSYPEKLLAIENFLLLMKIRSNLQFFDTLMDDDNHYFEGVICLNNC